MNVATATAGATVGERSTAGADASGTIRAIRAGGIAALLLAAGYVAIMPLFAMVGAPTVGALERLEYHTAGTSVWWAIVALSVATDLLFVPIAAALYAILRRVNQPAMLVATVFMLGFVVLDLAVLWPAKVSLITLGEAYGTAPGEQQAALVAAAAYPAAVLDSFLTPIYSILTLGIAEVLAGLVMLRGAFGRATAIVGIVTGALGIASVGETFVTGSFPVLVVGASLLTIAWLVLVGRDLLRMPAESASS
jgi:hypothetical protein